MQKENKILENYFKDIRQASVFVILNDDKLSFAESIDIKNKLLNQNVKIQRYILNKAGENAKDNSLNNYAGMPISVLPRSSHPLLGIEMFEKYCQIPEFMRYLDEISI